MKGISGDLFCDASVANIGGAFVQCAERLQNEGVDLDGYTMVEVVEDMEATRIALGYERVNLLSSSYGTRVAMIYAWMYPDSLYRSAMIAVNPPGHFVWEPEVAVVLLVIAGVAVLVWLIIRRVRRQEAR